MTAPTDTMTVATRIPDTSGLGAALATIVASAYATFPPGWSEQARLQAALEVARFVAGGPLAQQLLPQQVYTIPSNGQRPDATASGERNGWEHGDG